MASPVATIIWTKDGKTVSPLHSLTKGDSGSYVITAVNKHGVKQHRMIVNVQCKLFSLYHSIVSELSEIVDKI